MTRPASFLTLALGLAMLLHSTACTATKKFLKAKPVETTNFIERNSSMVLDTLGSGPFHYSWRTTSAKTQERERACTRLWIAPVDLRYLRPTSKKLMAWQENQGLERPFQQVATMMQAEFTRAFANSPRYQLVPQRGPGTVELHLALVEFNQTNGAGNIGKTVAGSFVGPLTMLASPFVKGAIAIEGKLKVFDTNDLVYQFTDSEHDRITFLSIRSYQAMGFAELAIKDWANQLELITRTPPDVGVRDSPYVWLNPL
jgi:hypothetical protein